MRIKFIKKYELLFTVYFYENSVDYYISKKQRNLIQTG